MPSLIMLYLLLHIGIRWVLGIIFYVGAELHGQIEFLLWTTKIWEIPNFPGKYPTSADFVNLHLINRNLGNSQGEDINKHHWFYRHHAEEGEESRFEWFIFVRIIGALNNYRLISVWTRSFKPFLSPSILLLCLP